jgi:preprotein translocase subunit YajC
MINMIYTWIVPVALADNGSQTPLSSSSSLWTFFPLILVFVIFYFLIFRPQQRQQKARKEMLGALKRGDQVITNGGIHGKITELHDSYAMLQVASNVVMKLDRSQINTVLNPEKVKPIAK